MQLGRDLMDSDYCCCHGEDVSRCLVTVRRDGKHAHACVTHNASQSRDSRYNVYMTEATIQVYGVFVRSV